MERTTQPRQVQLSPFKTVLEQQQPAPAFDKWRAVYNRYKPQKSGELILGALAALSDLMVALVRSTYWHMCCLHVSMPACRYMHDMWA